MVDSIKYKTLEEIKNILDNYNNSNNSKNLKDVKFYEYLNQYYNTRKEMEPMIKDNKHSIFEDKYIDSHWVNSENYNKYEELMKKRDEILDFLRKDSYSFNQFLDKYTKSTMDNNFKSSDITDEREDGMNFVGNELSNGQVNDVKYTDVTESSDGEISDFSEKTKVFINNVKKWNTPTLLQRFEALLDDSIERVILEKYINYSDVDYNNIEDRIALYFRIRDNLSDDEKKYFLDDILKGNLNEGKIKDILANNYIKDNGLDSKNDNDRKEAYEEARKIIESYRKYFNYNSEDLENDTIENNTMEFQKNTNNIINNGYRLSAPDMVNDAYFRALTNDSSVDGTTNVDSENLKDSTENSKEFVFDELQFKKNFDKAKNYILKNKVRMHVINNKKAKNKNKIIKGLIAASLAIVTSISSLSISNLFKKKDIDEVNDFTSNMIVTTDENYENSIDDNSIFSDKWDNKDIFSFNSMTEEKIDDKKIDDKKIDDKKVDNKKIDNKKVDVIVDTNDENSSLLNNDKFDFINIGDSVTISDNVIYSDVYSASAKENGSPAYHENDMVRNVSGILLTKNGNNYYSVNQDEVNKLRNDGWIDTSAMISNEGGFEGAEPIDNLIEHTNDLSVANTDNENNQIEKVNDKQDKNNKEYVEENNTENSKEKDIDNNYNTDENTLNNISDNVSKIMSEKKEALNYEKTENDIKNNISKIMAEKAAVGDKVTISDDVIYEDIYSASDKINSRPAYYDNNKVRSISSVLLTKDGHNYYSSNQNEIESLRQQGWIVSAVLISNENGLEGFEPIDNLNIVNDNNMGGKHI